MNQALWVLLQFALCAAAIGLAGHQLSRYGDIIAEKTGLGGAWIGLVLVATVTSLPELVTGVSAVALAGAPDIALGNVLGACMINLVMIAVLDLMLRGESLYRRASPEHILAAGFGVVMAGFVGFSLLFSRHGDAPAVGHVGLYSPLLVLLYAVAIRAQYRFERRQPAAAAGARAERYPGFALRSAARRFAAAAAVVVAAGLWLPHAARDLALVMGLGETFVGTLFVALATTLPEISVSVSALRLGALDLAVSNLLGSVLFDLMLVAVDDLAYLEGPLLAHVAPLHAVSALAVAMMCGVTIVGLFYRPRTQLFHALGWTSLALLLIYALNTSFHYRYGG